MTATDLQPLLPGEPAPALDAPLLSGGRWRLHDRTPRTLLLIVVYRGWHCGACRAALEDWNAQIGALEEIGVEALFISADPRARAEQSATEWDIGNLVLAYGWELEQARAWGLYVSGAIREEEPERFLEPGLFILDPDFMVHSLSVQSSQFARPAPADAASALRFIIEKDYPPRGTAAFIEDRSGDMDLSSAPGG